MSCMRGVLKSGLGRIRNRAPYELGNLLSPWLKLSSGFGGKGYVRLFSPLTHVLAVSGAGAGSGRFVPRDVEEVSGVAGCVGGQERFSEYGGLL